MVTMVAWRDMARQFAKRRVLWPRKCLGRTGSWSVASILPTCLQGVLAPQIRTGHVLEISQQPTYVRSCMSHQGGCWACITDNVRESWSLGTTWYATARAGQSPAKK